MKTHAPLREAKRFSSPRSSSTFSSLEPLESRIAPAFVASINGLEATLIGDATGETLSIVSSGSVLAHNRFTAGDPGFVSDLDFDSSTPGEQQFPSGLPGILTVDLGGGDDFFSCTGNIAALLSSLRVFGGAGNDTLLGSNGLDILSGGPGRDFIDGQQGNDSVHGGDGDDVFQWDPGDGSDIIDGGTGGDELVFNGSNAGEIFDLSEVAGRLRLFRNVGNIVMDVGTVEDLSLNISGGSDAVTVNDLSATDLRLMELHLGTPINATTPDTLVDSVIIVGSGFDDDIRVRNSGNIIEIVGLRPSVRIDGFDNIDTLSVSGGSGVDNVVATASARAKLAITTDGETENTAPPVLQFGVPASYDTGKGSSAVASGNLFGPGNDLVVANAKAGSLSILFNTGNGTFGTPLELSSKGKTPKSVVLEDFNNDGRLDIAVANSGSGNVGVLLNNGDGTFTEPTLFASGKKPGAMRSADVNGDGLADLVMITAGNRLSVLAGDGLGGFGVPTSIATGGVGPVAFEFGDFNDDGALDLAIAHRVSNNVTILTAGADLTFGTPLRLRVGVKPSALAVGDFDGDGRADLAVTHAVSRFVSVLLNASTGGITAFNPQLKLAHPGTNAPNALAVGDLDLDGRADLVIANTASGTISVLLNAGGAIFHPALRIDLDNTPPRKTSALILADLDGDGRLDIAAANPGTSDLSLIFRITG